MLDLVREAALDAMSLLFPVTCAGCDAPDRALCSACAALLGDPRLPLALEQHLVQGLRTLSAVPYEAPFRSMILAFKEGGRTDLARALSVPLRIAVERMARSAAGRVELCVIPASPRARRRRGYHPVELLTRAAGFRTSRVLQHVSATQNQKALDRAQRAVNLRGSLRAVPAAGRTFLLVDDVVTTGETLLEAVRALREAGATVCGAATLAFTPRRNGILGAHSARTRDIHRVEGYGG